MPFQIDRLPLRLINALAPIRICDIGGWTDTWFARYGQIFNLGVAPHAEVQIAVYPADELEERVLFSVENFGDHYVYNPDWTGWCRHPLLEACIRRMGLPDDLSLHITLFSSVPSGASTGTSAAVAVALLGALDALTPDRSDRHEIAYTAHAVETEMLRRQSGIQDQLCSAYGGANFIKMEKYPLARVYPITIHPEILWELEQRLALIYLGRSHDSSQIHEKVIAELSDAGPETSKLEDLRAAAEKARQALVKGDLAGFGQAMIENHRAQERLHPDLISQDARHVIEIARSYGATGWKVNGAGGEGGSLTLLCSPQTPAKRDLLYEIAQANPLFRHIPIRLDPYGLRVWDSSPNPSSFPQ